MLMAIYPIIMSQGKFIHKEALQFPMEERALQFGDGVYEVIRIYNGEPYLFHEHVERLFRSLEAIHLSIPETLTEVKELLTTLITKNDMETDGAIYLQISRGSAMRNHFFPEQTKPNMYAYLMKRERDMSLLNKGVRTITLPDERWKNCYIKSLNLLPNVLAKQTANEQACYEAILHKDGVVTEGSSSNIFLVRDGAIYTHPATKGILNGCVRMAVKRFAQALSIPFHEAPFTLQQIEQADELFLTSSTSEILAITHVDDQQINDGQRGPITKKLFDAYEVDANIKEVATL